MSDGSNTVIVSSLPVDQKLISDNQLRMVLLELFTQIGPVTKVSITSAPSRSSRIAYVDFIYDCSVPFSVKVLSGIKVFGKAVKLAPKNPKAHQGGKSIIEQASNDSSIICLDDEVNRIEPDSSDRRRSNTKNDRSSSRTDSRNGNQRKQSNGKESGEVSDDSLSDGEVGGSITNRHAAQVSPAQRFQPQQGLFNRRGMSNSTPNLNNPGHYQQQPNMQQMGYMQQMPPQFMPTGQRFPSNQTYQYQNNRYPNQNYQSGSRYR